MKKHWFMGVGMVLLATGPAFSQPVWQEPKTGMEFVWIPGGCFLMGMSPEEQNALKGEKNYNYWFKNAEVRHEICVAGFWLGKNEVTVGQFRKFATATGYTTNSETKTMTKNGCYAHVDQGDKRQWGYVAERNWQDPGYIQTDNHPVVCVGLDDAQSLTKWLGEGGQAVFRLPTEAEWEYAARAGTTTSRYWGEDPRESCRFANVADDTEDEQGHRWTMKHPCRDGHYWPSPVATFLPNAFGLHDMLGNVWEWVADWYDENYYAHSPRDNPTGPASGTLRVARGGSWRYDPPRVRAAMRHTFPMDRRGGGLGLRLAVTRPAPTP